MMNDFLGRNRMVDPHFALFRLRFRFRAEESIHFPEGKPGNIIRGAFGTILRRIACAPECPGAKSCPRRGQCPYARIFEPGSQDSGPSGLADWPRPFVFRAAHLNGQTVAPGRAFHFDVHLFDIHDPAIAYFVLTFAELARSGLGPRRGRAELLSVDQMDLQEGVLSRLFTGTSIEARAGAHPSRIPLSPSGTPVHRLRVDFITPTELKHEHALVGRPDFGVLFARVRDRIATLNRLYGAGILEIDFRSLGERAAAIRMTRCDLHRLDVERLSSRTGQRHPIGGFAGTAEYEGELSEFMPYLQAAVFAGIGRQTAFGNGEIRVAA